MYRGVAGEGVALSWGNKLLFSWSSAGDNTRRESLSSPVTCFNEEGLQDCHLHMKQINQSWRGKLNVLKCFWGLAPRTATYKGHIHSEGHRGESSSSRRRVYRKSNDRGDTEREKSQCLHIKQYFSFISSFLFFFKNIFNLLPQVNENAKSLEAVRQPWIN